jgi:hypothetical protein
MEILKSGDYGTENRHSKPQQCCRREGEFEALRNESKQLEHAPEGRRMLAKEQDAFHSARSKKMS